MIPLMRDYDATRFLWENPSVDDNPEHFNNTLTESSINSREIDFSHVSFALFCQLLFHGISG